MGQRRSPLDVGELERLAALGWRGSETGLLGDWLLRAGGGGFTGRAHSALAVGDPGLPLPEAVAAVTDWYDRRGVRPCVQLPGRQARAADTAFAAAGWDRDVDTVLLTVPMEGAQPPPAAPVHLATQPDDEWLAACQHGGGPLPPAAVHVLGNAARLAFASIRDDGEQGDGSVVAVARGVLTEGWLGITAVTVAEGARRGGLATSLTRALQAWALEGGGRWSYLQVVSTNAPARALYRRLGFIEHHRYHYRRAPLPGPAAAAGG